MIGYQVLWVEDEETLSDDVDVFKNIRNLIQEEQLKFIVIVGKIYGL